MRLSWGCFAAISFIYIEIHILFFQNKAIELNFHTQLTHLDKCEILIFSKFEITDYKKTNTSFLRLLTN